MAAPKLNYYEILGLNQSATFDEIRRAYRILARRYHPDLNPGKSSEERFKAISLAYQTLSDTEKKRNYDTEVESARRIRAGFAAYERAQSYAKHANRGADIKSSAQARRNQPPPGRTTETFVKSHNAVSSLIAGLSRLGSFWTKTEKLKPNSKEYLEVSKVSVIEVSVSMQDALFGGRKAVEVPSSPKDRKISLRIPAGVRSGSVLRLRSGTLKQEEYVVILRVAPDPLIELAAKGVLIDLPITISEALFGATLKVPGLEEEETLVIPIGSQSGQEIRLSNRGIKFDDGHRGDLFYRLNIQIPVSHQAVGLKEKVAAVAEYYEAPVRQGLPRKLKAG